jgi:hypothetical protein
MILEPEKFRSFELAGWESIPSDYHEAFASLTSQAITPLLDAARVKSGMTFLDIATGPGYVAAAAPSVARRYWGSSSPRRWWPRRSSGIPALNFAKGMPSNCRSVTAYSMRWR